LAKQFLFFLTTLYIISRPGDGPVTTIAVTMFDYSRTVVQMPGIMDSVLTRKAGGGEALDVLPSAPTLPRTQSLLRVAHNQPFFIGVAGEIPCKVFADFCLLRGTRGVSRAPFRVLSFQSQDKGEVA
jgi:hypothetical protein